MDKQELIRMMDAILKQIDEENDDPRTLTLMGGQNRALLNSLGRCVYAAKTELEKTK